MSTSWHTVYMGAEILCVECRACNKRASLTKQDGLPIYQGNMDAVRKKTFRCSRCKSIDVRIYAPKNKNQALMFEAGDPMPAGCEVV
jgi:hypothetical protein